MIRAGVLATWVVALIPTPAGACAMCLTSTYGDRSFNWAFAILMLMPFAVAAGVCVVLLVLAGSFGGSLPRIFSRDGAGGSGARSRKGRSLDAELDAVVAGERFDLRR